MGGGSEDEANLGGRCANDADLGGGGDADLGGAGEDEFGGGSEADLGGVVEDEFGGGGGADLGGAGGQVGVFETEVDIETEVHSWDESETEDEDFVDILVNVMGDINNFDNDVGFVIVEVGITKEENESECEHRGNVRKHIDTGLSND